MSTANSFLVGDRVSLHSLQTQSLNGKKGTIAKFVKDEGRWAVKIDGVTGVPKKIKPSNLKHQDTIAVVVVPPTGDIRYEDVPVTSLEAYVQAKQAFLEDSRSNNIYHYYRLPEDKIGYMTMKVNDSFLNYPVNTNLVRLGWTSPAETIQGTVVVSFSNEQQTMTPTLYEPYELVTVKRLLNELAEARVPRHPTRNRIAKGHYLRLDPMPGIKCRCLDARSEEDED
uniref:Uncharacterized protein n=1 Tax=Grammatophora oceanica TaxID=210454 RepID=A0A7S1VIR4_9STRA|mmetsp:Transcript_46324/g.68968  ORF Transcript_46324/g.68968 Transcript_46324/m.68968 type:complete len:226 (+) Transcript_46324:92-769(+)|eukprot:CAMPEP_0194030644 /NCGR_PEP_ID=MMETSP0009_2-20130614/4044_1 /TAXON_ID=210454 /ORGANISM="Grammatophora oceanica, Strain CCMP 410" /LENGTH=225 /DNA_ID=CAMNT_0038670619 /DNA_START=64 /DNA_END=741 /DNA_ORIENTATION=+